eukprot:CAMPEP_0171305518 /NCGR_PEP_ID=MMETSP0816-20121228/15387_1 /TAXON_ID=420281 /ORGANISM="Proboscia inermis, Strain CCAP1064/1" /LENGTH=61 /DNA_ID=CAMNT_0011786423 /DNA_START=821 /DNA_END=1006 /DNA_ORIENTATION=-
MTTVESTPLSVWLPNEGGTIQICARPECEGTEHRSNASFCWSCGSNLFTNDLTSSELTSEE